MDRERERLWQRRRDMSGQVERERGKVLAMQAAREQERVAAAEALAEALRDGDANMSTAQRQREAAAMRGAFPGNRPCPCGSNKKFKRCCGVPTS